MGSNSGDYTDCGMLIKLISDQIESRSNRVLHERNLTASQFRYLEFLDQKGDTVLFKDVERHFQTSQPTVSGIMSRLAEKGLIDIEAADSGRAKKARLTEKGKTMVDDSRIVRKTEEERILGALKEEEREPFHDMLVRISRQSMD
jgi:DNA-binding MarR family transcriptional regulator